METWELRIVENLEINMPISSALLPCRLLFNLYRLLQWNFMDWMVRLWQRPHSVKSKSPMGNCQVLLYRETVYDVLVLIGTFDVDRIKVEAVIWTELWVTIVEFQASWAWQWLLCNLLFEETWLWFAVWRDLTLIWGMIHQMCLWYLFVTFLLLHVNSANGCDLDVHNVDWQMSKKTELSKMSVPTPISNVPLQGNIVSHESVLTGAVGGATVHSGARARTMTEKGLIWQLETQKENFQSSISAWRRRAGRIERLLSEAVTTIELKRSRDEIENEMSQVTATYEKMDDLLSKKDKKGSAYEKYEQIEKNHHDLLKRVSQCIRELDGSGSRVSKGSKHSSKRSRSSHLSNSSSKRADAIAEAAVLQTTQQTSRYWPNTGPIPLAVLAQYCKPVPARYGFAHRICIGPVPFYSIGPVQGQYWADTGPVPICLYWPSIGPIPHIRYWSSTGPVPDRYRPNTGTVFRYWPSTGPVPVQYWFVCTGPVLDQYRISGIGPVPDGYRPNTGTVFRYWPSTGPIPGKYRFVCTGPVQIQYWGEIG